MLEEKFEAHGVARLKKSINKLNNENTSLGEDKRTVDDKFNKRKRTENCSKTNNKSRFVVLDDEDDDDEPEVDDLFLNGEDEESLPDFENIDNLNEEDE